MIKFDHKRSSFTYLLKVMIKIMINLQGFPLQSEDLFRNGWHQLFYKLYLISWCRPMHLAVICHTNLQYKKVAHCWMRYTEMSTDVTMLPEFMHLLWSEVCLWGHSARLMRCSLLVVTKYVGNITLDIILMNWPVAYEL